ncbi:hypothetical protein NEIELOOT_01434 [Neisseria elongata subsp. glycolytica ATCC 29315]|uniref:Uncharacterized protein n=1 Tax=Neisseria elongata subsp. glycolytica ATCC 29315 TaxID=546263 RepID=D4DQU3_NEIEG|nr:hypothetical protein NEIELOOT_01434 [Neisseria elongata subsp. glycolytica ATCC 29315]
MEFLKTILVVVITGWIGNKITQIFQENHFVISKKLKCRNRNGENHRD